MSATGAAVKRKSVPSTHTLQQAERIRNQQPPRYSVLTASGAPPAGEAVVYLRIHGPSRRADVHMSINPEAETIAVQEQREDAYDERE